MQMNGRVELRGRMRRSGNVVRMALFIVAAGICASGIARPKKLESGAVTSPDSSMRAEAEWEDVGYVGLLRVRIFDKAGKELRAIEVPEINPQPISLAWIDNEWTACESYIGPNGAGFFYAHVPTGRGYLVEIVQPRPGADWIFTAGSNYPASRAFINSITRGHNSLFPIMLRNAPERQTDYFKPEFCRALAAAVDAYNEYRRASSVREIDLLSDADIRPELGAVCVADVNEKPEVIYFPVGAGSPQEMFSRLKRQPLPPEVEKKLDESGAPEPRVRWLANGEYVVQAAPETDAAGTTTPGVEFYRGKFENVSDTPVATPAPTPVVTAAPTVAVATKKPGKAGKGKSPEVAGDKETNKATPKPADTAKDKKDSKDGKASSAPDAKATATAGGIKISPSRTGTVSGQKATPTPKTTATPKPILGNPRIKLPGKGKD